MPKFRQTVPVSGSTVAFRYMAILFLMFVGGNLFAANSELNARLDSREIPVGGYTYLNIEVEGVGSADVETPHIDGLVFRRSGNSSNTSIVNGRVSRSVTLRFTILGETEGTYTIPPLEVTTDDQTYQTKPLQITVSKVANTSTRSSRPSSSDVAGNLTAEEIHRIAFISIKTGKDKAYIGESIPLTLKLYLNTGARFNQINQAPSIENDAIMIPTFGEDFQQTIENVDGERYQVFAWDSAFSATKSGETTLKATLELSFLVRARRQNSFPSSIFDSDFFSPSFQAVPIIASSNELPLKILPVPENQPEGFTGAIGDFQLKVTGSPLQIVEGDPITLHIDISGTGNFDRVFNEGLTGNNQFKTYTPEEEFVPATEGSMIHGTKSFTQAIIPIDVEQTQIPSISFTFLNSKTGSFETLESPPIPIKIIPSSRGVRTASGPETVSERKRENIDTDGLISFTVNLDPPHSTIRPLCTRSLYRNFLWATPAALLLLSLCCSVVLQNKNRAEEKILKERKKELKRIAVEIDKAQKSTDPTAFIKASAQYTRTLLAYLWGTPGHAVTSADVKNRLKASAPAMTEILSLSETIAYAGGSLINVDTAKLHASLKEEWQNIESRLDLS